MGSGLPFSPSSMTNFFLQDTAYRLGEWPFPRSGVPRAHRTPIDSDAVAATMESDFLTLQVCLCQRLPRNVPARGSILHTWLDDHFKRRCIQMKMNYKANHHILFSSNPPSSTDEKGMVVVGIRLRISTQSGGIYSSLLTFCVDLYLYGRCILVEYNGV